MSTLDRTCFFISLLRAEPAFWYSIWLVNWPKLMVPVPSRRSVPMMAGPVWTLTVDALRHAVDLHVVIARIVLPDHAGEAHREFGAAVGRRRRIAWRRPPGPWPGPRPGPAPRRRGRRRRPGPWGSPRRRRRRARRRRAARPRPRRSSPPWCRAPWRRAARRRRPTPGRGAGRSCACGAARCRWSCSWAGPLRGDGLGDGIG